MSAIKTYINRQEKNPKLEVNLLTSIVLTFCTHKTKTVKFIESTQYIANREVKL